MDEKTKIGAAFVAAWNDCENPALDGVNPHFGNRYATLAATLEEVRKACKKNGIAYVQRLVPNQDGMWYLQSSVTDGEETAELSVFPVNLGGNAQQFGSEMTYRKRQQAQADWGIVGEEDDDGEAAVGNQQPKQQQPKKAERKASPKQVEVIARAFQGERLADMLHHYGIHAIDDLTMKQASDLIGSMRK